MNDVWTIRATLDWCEGYLARAQDVNPRVSAQHLLSFATGLSRIELYAHHDRPLSPDERDTLRDAVRRRAAGEPLQYIQGTAPFRFIELEVAPGVLIPRPETEVLVDEAFRELKNLGAYAARRSGPHAGEPSLPSSEGAASSGSAHPGVAEEANGTHADGLAVADVCTGSGCIACAIASEHPDARVVATDISPDAVALARRNVARLGLGDRVDVREGDLCAPLAADAPFDLVISNPPYVPTAVLNDMPREVSVFEPALALDGGCDGLDAFRRLIDEAVPLLSFSGVLACELHEDCLDKAADLARSAGLARVRIASDLAGRPRVLIAAKAS